MRQPTVNPPAGRPPGRLTSRLQGAADLSFQVRGGRTRLTRSRTVPPLLAQRALYPDPGAPDMAFVYLGNSTAGVLQGDDLRVCVHVGHGAKVHITTPAATKLFSMPEAGATQTTRLYLDQSAYLEYLPEPLVPFKDAKFSQTTIAKVGPEATLLIWELITPGRAASGEVLEYDRLEARLTIEDSDGAPVYHEASSLTPKTVSPAGLAVLGTGGAPVLGTLVIVTRAVESAILREGLVHQLASRPGNGDHAKVGLSVLPDGRGAGVKVLGGDTESVRKVLLTAWREARRQLLGAELPQGRRY